ncbi:RHS repeat-associated core domain-containing protein, partial [Algimonas porphyrae]
RGNLTTSTFVDFFGGINRTKTMTYDLSDQMIAMSGQVPDGSPVNGTFEYNGEGKRVQMTMNGRNSFYVYDFAGRLMLSHKEADGEGVERLYLESGQALGKWTGTKLTYFHTDHLGTPIRGTHGMGGTETVGADVFQQFQTPYGMQPTTSWHGTGNTGFDPAFGQGSNCGVTGFTTHANDCETGLTYMQARYYDPVSSRFTSVDPVTFTNTGNTGMINRYGYVENDPISFLDPYGTDKVHISVGGYFVAGIGYTVNLGVAVDFSPERRTGFLPDISIYSTTGRQGGFGGGVGVDLGYFRGGNEDFYGRGSQLVGDTPAIGITLSEPNSSTEFNNSGDIAVGLGYAAGLTGGEVNTRNLFSTKDFANTIDMLIGGEVSSSNASNLASRYLGKDIEVTQVDSSTQTFSFTRTGSRLKQKVTCKSSGDGTSSC